MEINRGKNKNGPPLLVEFYLGPMGISKIQASVRPGKEGLEWQVLGGDQPRVVELIKTWIEDYCAKRQPSCFLPLSFDHLPPFTRQVLQILQTQPFGKTLSYKELAKLAGNPEAARAAGSACGRNPYIVVVPCHRVLASQGKLGGFSCDPAIKKCLLKFEGISLSDINI